MDTRYEMSQVIEIGNEVDCGIAHAYVIFRDNEGHYDVECSCEDHSYTNH